jgi:putative transposase
MAHARRRHVPGGIYLVSSAGECGQAIFVSDADRIALGRLVGQVIGRCGAQVHAFKWLENEILMVLQVFGISLSGVMQRITSVHARRVNTKLGYKGNLFRHPHRAMLLPDVDSVVRAIATVHGYPESVWSSHRAYLGLEEIPWLTKQTILELLSATPELQLSAYAEMIEREKRWKAAVCSGLEDSARTRGCRPYDQFLAWLKVRSMERARPASLDELIAAVAGWFQVDPAAIESEAASPLLSLARALITCTAMENGIASLADLAQRFHRGRSTLHGARETYRVRLPELFNIPLMEILKGPGRPLSHFTAATAAPADRLRIVKK